MFMNFPFPWHPPMTMASIAIQTTANLRVIVILNLLQKREPAGQTPTRNLIATGESEARIIVTDRLLRARLNWAKPPVPQHGEGRLDSRFWDRFLLGETACELLCHDLVLIVVAPAVNAVQ